MSLTSPAGTRAAVSSATQSRRRRMLRRRSSSSCRRARFADARSVARVVLRSPRAQERPSTRASARELLVGADREHHSPRLAAHELVRRDARVLVAHALRHPPASVNAEPWLTSAASRQVQQVHLHALALAGALAMAQRRQHTHRSEQPADHVHERHADLLRLAVALAPVMLISPPRACTSRSYPGSAAPAPAPNAVIEQYTSAAVERPRLLVAEAEGVHHTRAEVLHHHRRARDQLAR